jgi:tetratricopeptide (TPR) repeat protein
MALRMLELDPRFSYAALYAAGALAFNLDRPDEALALLDSARRGEPRDWRYGAAIAAIGFHKKGDGASVLRELEPVLRDSECPPMIKNMAAFLCLRLGRRERAASLYGEMLSSKDPAYRETARKALERLGGHRKQHGT